MPQLKRIGPTKLTFLSVNLFLYLFLIAVPSTVGQELATGNTEKNKSGEARANGRAQTDSNSIAPAASSSNGSKVSASDEIATRMRALEETLERQTQKLDEMQRTIDEQQQTIRQLSDRLLVVEAKPEKATETSTATDSAAAIPQKQTPSLEERMKKVEDQVLKIGAFRFSGDFRLQSDTTLRSASEPPAPPLTHVQNARARYRLRLNLDVDVNKYLSFHGQLASGQITSPLTNNQEFGAIGIRQPFFISEAWADYHPTKSLQLLGGRVQEIFNDNSRFLFDEDLRLNGFNERYSVKLNRPFAYITGVELRAGQYILTNPNVAIVTAGSPLARAGAPVGTTGRSANLFHQGIVFDQKFNEKWSDQIMADIQLYRNPNQIQLASAADGLALIIQPTLGLALAAPVVGTGNATTTPGGAVYSAGHFQIVRLNYRLNYAGIKYGSHVYPVLFNAQVARNIGTGMKERDSMMAGVQVGRVAKFGDIAFLYNFYIKGANSIVSQFTDDDVGTGTGVNIRTHYFRFELGLAKRVTFQSLLFRQTELRTSGQYPNFFVPLGAQTPPQYRIQQQVVFSF